MTRTNAFTLLCVAIRAIALWCLISFLVVAATQVTALHSVASGDGEIMAVFAAVLVVVLGLIAVLWLFADKIARLALVRPQDQTFESDLEPAIWLGLAISAIGAWHLFSAVTGAGYLAIRWLGLQLIAREQPGLDASLDAEGVTRLASFILQGVLGLVCLLRGKGLAGWVHRMRYGRHAEAPPEA